MDLEFYTYNDLTPKDESDFRAQGVCMDDWDYMILAPIYTIEFQKSTMINGGESGYWRQKNSILDRLLTGCCSNEWYKAQYHGKMYAVGVAYHS